MLYIGSVFESRNCKWQALQKKFICATTDVAFELVPVYSDEIKERRHEHADGLWHIRKAFLDIGKPDDRFLFLDSDAFPIRCDWVAKLSNAMTNGKDIAVAVRSENLETRLHASILYVHSYEALMGLCFEIDTKKDLLFNDETDICIQPYEEWRQDCFPLLRSNRVNVHPVLAGIYYNIFYHHGCGSRKYCMRSTDYWAHCVTPIFEPLTLQKQLFANPSEFISQLVWDKGRFPKIDA